MLTHGIPPASHDSVPFYTVSRHRVSPEFIRQCIRLPMAFPAESSPAQGSPQGSSRNGRFVFMYGHTYGKSRDQPGKVVSPARGQLNRGNEYFPVRVRA